MLYLSKIGHWSKIMNKSDEAKVRILAEKLHVKVGKEIKRKSARGSLRRICRVVIDGANSPERKSLKKLMKGSKKLSWFRRKFFLN